MSRRTEWWLNYTYRQSGSVSETLITGRLPIKRDKNRLSRSELFFFSVRGHRLQQYAVYRTDSVERVAYEENRTIECITENDIMRTFETFVISVHKNSEWTSCSVIGKRREQDPNTREERRLHQHAVWNVTNRGARRRVSWKRCQAEQTEKTVSSMSEPFVMSVHERATIETARKKWRWRDSDVECEECSSCTSESSPQLARWREHQVTHIFNRAWYETFARRTEDVNDMMTTNRSNAKQYRVIIVVSIDSNAFGRRNYT